MFEAFKSVRKERAEIERDRLYLESMAADDMIENYMNLIPGSMMEDVDVSDAEIEALIDKIPDSDNVDQEVEDILKSKKNISIDDLIGITNGREEDSEDLIAASGHDDDDDDDDEDEDDD